MKNEEIKEILKDNDELVVVYNDNSTRTFDTLTTDVLDYITNLQQENERLKEELNYTVSQVQHNQIVTKLCKEKEDYKSRCKEAIELYKKCKEEDYCILSIKMYEILIGSDDK